MQIIPKKLSSVSATIIALGLVAVVGMVDFWTGREISFSIFYLLPILIVVPYAPLFCAIFVAVTAAVTWLLAENLAPGPPYSSEVIPYWNAFMRLGFFVLIAVLFKSLRKHQETLAVTVGQRTETLRKEIAEHRVTEDALRNSEHRYRSLFENNPLPMFVYDFDSLRILAVNDSAISHYGYSRVAFLSMTIKDIRPPEDIPLLPENLSRPRSPLETGTIARHRKKDGTVFPVEISSHTIQFAGKSAVLVMVNDITQRKSAEDALREREEMFRTLFDESPDAICVEDFNGTVLDANAAACRLYGVNREKLVGQNVVDLVPADKRAETKRVFPLFVKGEIDQVESYSLAAGEKKIPVEIRASRIEYRGRPALLLHVRDITERRKIEHQLLQSQKMEAVGRLAGGIAHDFNNLLTVIAGYSERVLLGTAVQDPHRVDLLQIKKASNRAADLTRQLLTFSRSHVATPDIVNLNNVMADVTHMLRRLIGENIELVTIPGRDLERVRIDPQQVEHIIVNLAINGRDAMPSGGRLTIQTGNVKIDGGSVLPHTEIKPGNYVMLSVTDTGCGMDAETRAKLFEPFFTTKGPGKGTGLGLATCYGIVKQSHGHITIDSELGQGTTVRIYFPREDARPEPKPHREEALPAAHGHETVLVVEDELTVREFVVLMLADHGYNVLQASNGIEALQQLDESREEGVDLLVTDIVMPQMSGRELVERAKARYPRLRVLFMSGYTDNELSSPDLLPQGLYFLEKPFSSALLLNKVREVLDGNHATSADSKQQ